MGKTSLASMQHNFVKLTYLLEKGNFKANCCFLPDPVVGASGDWFLSLGIRFGFTLELRNASGPNNFLLPPEEIRPSGEETWAAFKWVVAFLSEQVLIQLFSQIHVEQTCRS